MARRVRADQLLADQGLAESREQAKRLIMAGKVHALTGGQKTPVLKPGQQMDPGTTLVAEAGDRFVSRGGHKLLTAIEELGLDPAGKTALDAGASSGGFTDCLLQHGAARVYAADVGAGQLHWSLRRDPRVTVLEKVNLRRAPDDLLPEKVDLITADLSFISLRLVLGPCLKFLKDRGEVVVLIKPQFELGPGRTDKGVVRSEADRMEAVDAVIGFARDELGLEPLGWAPARIKGPKGNQEYLARFRRRA
ncbi:MAG: TlyA family RNA methyltransferase [Desulfovibrionaceae bacterium]|nr:TlyA family RNA methyltransferase [Desulfovibrionaceae bacterium]MDD4951667.1 TlyA family RNA methyltransferase [Desulfovibrionaceae bacterium]